LINQCREIAQAQRVDNLQETRDITEPRVNNAGGIDFGKCLMEACNIDFGNQAGRIPAAPPVAYCYVLVC
jgi:hypothetical protein